VIGKDLVRHGELALKPFLDDGEDRVRDVVGVRAQLLSHLLVLLRTPAGIWARLAGLECPGGHLADIMEPDIEMIAPLADELLCYAAKIEILFEDETAPTLVASQPDGDRQSADAR
jgi:hypothetical protein